MKDNIYLCGFMGCGKSTVGRVLAQQLHCPFIDLDDLIVAKMGMRIPDIFQQKGEAFFRTTERNMLRDVSRGQRGSVIACGGGALVFEANAQLAHCYGKIVLLNVPFSMCYDRIHSDPNRPIASSSTRKELLRLYRLRYKRYHDHADLVIPVLPQDTPEQIAERIRIE